MFRTRWRMTVQILKRKQGLRILYFHHHSNISPAYHPENSVFYSSDLCEGGDDEGQVLGLLLQHHHRRHLLHVDVPLDAVDLHRSRYCRHYRYYGSCIRKFLRYCNSLLNKFEILSYTGTNYLSPSIGHNGYAKFICLLSLKMLYSIRKKGIF